MVFSRSGSCYKALPAAFGSGALAQVSYYRRTMYLAVALGAVLFSAGFFLARNGDGKSIPLIAFIYTPLFSLPLTASLVKHRRIGFWGALILMLGLAAAHYLAIDTAAGIYDYKICAFLDASQNAACQASQATQQLASRTLPAGFCGGVVGAGVSFVLLLSLRPLRSWTRFAVMITATLALGVLGAIGLSFGLPDDRGALSFVFGLFLPWQLAFGAVLVLLFDGEAMNAVTRLPSPSREA